MVDTSVDEQKPMLEEDKIVVLVSCSVYFLQKLNIYTCQNLKNPKILTLTWNNFFSPHGINRDFWHFISTSVPKVSTKI